MTRLVSAALVSLLAAACGSPCRAVAVRPLDVACEGSSTFKRELHFDDRATFESFLDAECMPSADDEAIDAILDGVDFTRDAVFVAAGLKKDGFRCIEGRREDSVEVCESGLRVAFADDISNRTDCDGKWTVAFALPRGEMRAALEE